MLCIAWTTVAKKTDAEQLATDVISRGLAACVQIEGPVTSYYRWAGRIERADEFRLTFKCLAEKLGELQTHVLANHPYETPEWTAVRADHVSEKYLSWAEANSSNPPL